MTRLKKENSGAYQDLINLTSHIPHPNCLFYMNKLCFLGLIYESQLEFVALAAEPVLKLQSTNGLKLSHPLAGQIYREHIRNYKYI